MSGEPLDGASVGPLDGVSVGPLAGASVGPLDGASLGPLDGASVGPLGGASAGPLGEASAGPLGGHLETSFDPLNEEDPWMFEADPSVVDVINVSVNAGVNNGKDSCSCNKVDL